MNECSYYRSQILAVLAAMQGTPHVLHLI